MTFPASFCRAMLVACLVFLSLVAAQEPEPELIAEDGPERCCLPDQFNIRKSGTIGVVQKSHASVGQIPILEDSHQVYDYVNGFLATNITRNLISTFDWTSGEWATENIQVIQDLKKNTSILIDYNKRTCVEAISADFAFALHKCIPDHWQASGYPTIAGKVDGVTWASYLPPGIYENTYGLWSITVGQDTCIPLEDKFLGNLVSWGEDQQISAGTVYFDYKEEIDEEAAKLFVKPDFCGNYKEKGRKNGGPRDNEGRERHRKGD